MERRVRSHGGISRKGAGDERRLRRTMGAEQTCECERSRSLGAVDQCQPFLGGKHDRFQAGLFQRLCAGEALALIKASPSPIMAAVMCASGARSPEAPTEPFRGSSGSRLFQHVFDEGDDFKPYAGCAATERNQLQRHDETHDVFRKRLADAAAMREDQIALQGGDIACRDADRGEFSEARIDAVNRLVACRDFRNARCRFSTPA